MVTLRVSFLTALAIVLASCSSIKIESGTPREQTENNEAYASDIRTDFAQQINSVEPDGQLKYLIDYAEFVGGNIVNYGAAMAQQWYEGEEGRGEVITDEEMRGLIDRSIASEKPIMRAWEDNLEYGYRVILDGEFFRPPMLESIQALIDSYYDLHSAVTLPNGSPEDYEDRIDETRRAFERRIRDIRRDGGLY